MDPYKQPSKIRAKPAQSGAEPPAQAFACIPDAGFVEWMASARASLAVSTYQAGSLMLVGWNGSQVSFLPRQFDKPMGLDVVGDRMALATRNAITVFGNDTVLAQHYDPQRPGRYDALFLPRVSYHTSQLDIHDVAVTDDDLWFVNTRCSCLAGVSERYAFASRWRPPFVSDDVPEDRCHLNGLALVDGKPGFVTCFGISDTPGGWRANKANGGIVMHVDSGTVVRGGLAMPHSPRWYDGSLWLVNSGTGELLRVDPERGDTDVVVALPGYLRGLTFIDRYAIVGLCKIREQHIFGGLPVEARYPALKCAIAIVDIDRGVAVGLLEFTTTCTEIYDIRVLPGVRRPNVMNLAKEQAHLALNAEDLHCWLQPDQSSKAAPPA